MQGGSPTKIGMRGGTGDSIPPPPVFRLYSAGDASFGGLGNTLNGGTAIKIPTAISPGKRFISFCNSDSSPQATLGVSVTGQFWFLGDRLNGLAGDGTNSGQVNLPGAVTIVGSNWTQVACGANSACGLSGGELWCWGNQLYGRVGNGVNTNAVVARVRLAPNNNWQMVSVGRDHAAGISGGELYTWGRNNNGELGQGDTTTRTTPTRVQSSSNWTWVSCGAIHTLGISGGALYAWGNNGSGRLGDGTTTTRNSPTRIGSGTDWVKVSAGSAFSLGLTGSTGGGSLFGWGVNSSGQLGINNFNAQTTPQLIGSHGTWQDMCALQIATVGISGGELWAWGGNIYGNAMRQNRINAAGTGYTGYGDPAKYQIGNNWSLAMTQNQNGSVGCVNIGTGTGLTSYTWGNNGARTCYFGWDIYNSNTMTEVSVISSNAQPIGSSIDSRITSLPKTFGESEDTLMIFENKMYGLGRYGTLLANLGREYMFDAQIHGGLTWSSVAVNGRSALAIAEGRLYGVGANGNGQLGQGNTTTRSTMGQVQSSSNWTDVSVFTHALGISGGSLYAWGYQGDGRLGDGVSANANVTLPKLIDSGTNWTQVCVGDNHSLGISGGMLYGWGRNNNGQVGNGTQVHVLTPTEIGGGSTAWTKISAAWDFSAGICGGALYTWGINNTGQLGLGNTTTRLTPTRVDSGTQWSEVCCLNTIWTSGPSINRHTMGISGGSLYACGSNTYGQLGLGAVGQQNRFARVGSLTGWTQVAGVTPFWSSVLAVRQTAS